MSDNLKIKRLKNRDLSSVSKIVSENFSQLKDIKKAKRWVGCNFLAFPRAQYFVAKLHKETVGYILWSEKGGFREEAVFELEQIAVAEKFRGKGVGIALILKSLSEVKKYLKKRKSKLKMVIVSVRKENPTAQALYKKTLGAKVECIIKDYLRGDEALMVGRKN